MSGAFMSIGPVYAGGYMRFKTPWLAVLCASSTFGCATSTPESSPSFEQARSTIEPADASSAQPVKLDGSLDAYLEHAFSNRPELRAGLQRWRASQHRVDTVDELGPLTLSYAFFLRSVETRVGPQRHRAGIKQTIPWPGKAQSQMDTERARVRVSEHQFSTQLVDTRWQVVDAYWANWQVMQHHMLHEQHTEIVRMLAESARSRLETGQARVADVSQADLLLSRTVDDAAESLEDHRRASYALARATGLNFDDDLPISGEPPDPRLPAEPIEDLIAAARAHPNIESIRALKETSNRQASAAAQRRRPDLTLGLEWIETGGAIDPQMPESGKDPVIASVSISLPIWAGETYASEEQARAEALAFESDARAAERDAESALRQAVAGLRDTAKRIRLYESTLIPQAESMLGSVSGAYEVGKTQIASLLIAQDELLNLRLRLVMVRAEHERQWAALERIVARPIDSEVYR